MLIKGLIVGVNAAYTDAIFTQTINTFVDGERLFLVPKYTASATADYNFPLTGDWTGNVGGDFSYTSSELDTTDYPLPSYGILNFMQVLRATPTGWLSTSRTLRTAGHT